MTMQSRRRPARLLLAAALASAGAWAPPALAQSGAETPETGEEAESDALPEARGPRLDALFDRLAASEEGAHERWEREIRRIWSNSGSDTADLLLERGREALSEEETVKALHHFTALVQHRPGFAEGWNARATAFYADGELGAALADIERALALEPRHFGALSGLGVILERIGREEDALLAYRAAADLNPHIEPVNEAIERLAPEVDGRDA